MALIHEFILVPKPKEVNCTYENIVRDSSGKIDITKSNIIDLIEIHDDIIIYIMDTLKWIPSKNPAFENTPKGFGLNYYGITLFDKDSVPIIKIFLTGGLKYFLRPLESSN